MSVMQKGMYTESVTRDWKVHRERDPSVLKESMNTTSYEST